MAVPSPRLQRGLMWSGLLLMAWAANGLPLTCSASCGSSHSLSTGRGWRPGRWRSSPSSSSPPRPRQAARPRVPSRSWVHPRWVHPRWVHPRRSLVRLPPRSCSRCPTGDQDVVGAGRDARTHVARRGRQWLRRLGGFDPVADGGRSVLLLVWTPPGCRAGCSLAAGWSTRSRRHDRPAAAGRSSARLSAVRRPPAPRHGGLGPWSLLRQLVPVGDRVRCCHPLVSVAQCR